MPRPATNTQAMTNGRDGRHSIPLPCVPRPRWMSTVIRQFRASSPCLSPVDRRVMLLERSGLPGRHIGCACLLSGGLSMRLYRAVVSPVCGVLVVVGLAAPAPAREAAQANPIPVDQWADSACRTLSNWDLTTQSEVVDAQSTLKKARKLKGTAQ